MTGRNSLGIAIALAALAFETGAEAAKTADNVYALCTVRDVTVSGDQMRGKIYRSAIFSAPRSYEAVISPKPDKGSKVSAEFEKFVWRTYGFRPDRMSLDDRSEHWCIEEPLTLAGKEQLTKVASEWDRAKFPEIEMVKTSWSRAKSAADERYDAELAEYEASLRATREAEEKYKQDVAAMEDRKSRNVAAAKAALDQFARDSAAHDAEVARIQADADRQRQAYREEYKRVMGRYPDE